MRHQITHSNVVHIVSKRRKHTVTNAVNYFDCLKSIGQQATFMISWHLPNKWN